MNFHTLCLEQVMTSQINMTFSNSKANWNFVKFKSYIWWYFIVVTVHCYHSFMQVWESHLVTFTENGSHQTICCRWQTCHIVPPTLPWISCIRWMKFVHPWDKHVSSFSQSLKSLSNCSQGLWAFQRQVHKHTLGQNLESKVNKKLLVFKLQKIYTDNIFREWRVLHNTYWRAVSSRLHCVTTLEFSVTSYLGVEGCIKFVKQDFEIFTIP